MSELGKSDLPQNEKDRSGNLNFFDKIADIYYINLSNRTEKNEYMSALLHKYFHSKNIIRFNAISRDTMARYKVIYQERLAEGYRYFNDKKEIVLPGIIACFLSHYFVLKKIQNKVKLKGRYAGKYFLVFEDDTSFDDALIDAFMNLEDYLPADWDVIIGLNDLSPLFESEEKYAINKYLCDIRNMWHPNILGANLMIYNPEKIDSIVGRIENYPEIRDYDGLVSVALENRYCFRKRYVSVGEFRNITDTSK